MSSVYLDYFGLQKPPFAITPDPGYVYLSKRHQDALAHLLYAIGQGGSGGFVQLTGEVGTGKTTLCRCLLEQVPDNTRIALILNPVLSPHDLLQAVCEELHIDYAEQATSRQLVNLLSEYLLAAHGRGERVVLVIDEAQNMQPAALEQVRLLTNLETHTDKLLQIILLGQPELRTLLARQELRQLAQRITARYHLEPLDYDETIAYVRHRLSVAGRAYPLFSKNGYKALYQLSSGVPRLINIFADRALMGAFATDSEKISARLVRQAGREVGSQSTAPRAVSSQWLWPSMAVLLVAVGLSGMYWFSNGLEGNAAQPQVGSSEAIAEADSQSVRDAGQATVDDSNAENVNQPEAATGAQALMNTGLTDVVSDAGITDGSNPGDQPPAIDFDDWLNNGDPIGLWGEWGAAWQVDGATVRAACQRASEQSNEAGSPVLDDPYFCVSQEGSWGRIRQLDMPVALRLGESSAPVLIQGITAQSVLLHNGDRPRWQSLADLRGYWDGQFTAVCPGRAQTWQLGDDDTDIVQLKQRAAALHLQPYDDSDESSRYNAGFAQWVEQYQLRNGLQPDRIIGVETRLFLCAEHTDTPHLLASR